MVFVLLQNRISNFYLVVSCCAQILNVYANNLSTQTAMKKQKVKICGFRLDIS